MQAVRLLWIVKQVVIQRWLVCWLRGRQVLRTQRKLSYVGQFFLYFPFPLFIRSANICVLFKKIDKIELSQTTDTLSIKSVSRYYSIIPWSMRLRWAKRRRERWEKQTNREIITTNIVDHHPKTRSRCSPIFMEIFLGAICNTSGEVI